MQPVRPLGVPPPPEPRRRGLLLLVAGAAVVAAAVLAPAGPGTLQVSELDPPDPLADAGSRQVDLIYRFNAFLASGDHAAAAALISDDWSVLALPALPFRFVPDGADSKSLTAPLAFYGDVVAATVAACRAERTTLTGADVVCEHRLDSAWADAVRIGGRTTPVTYQVGGGEILAILTDHRGSPAITSLCYYAEQTVHGAQAPLFDADCAPLTDAPPEAHQAAAADFVAAGRPGGGLEYRVARSGVSAASVFVATHNRGGRARALAYGDASASGFPGLVSEGLPPRLADFLEWSQVAYRIDLGPCWVDGSEPDSGLRLTCEDAVWTGPLIEGLALESVPQPVSFLVSNATIQSVSGGTAPGLAHAFGRFCEWIHANRPEVVPVVFAMRCRPLFTADAAGRLLLVLADYKADAR